MFWPRMTSGDVMWPLGVTKIISLNSPCIFTSNGGSNVVCKHFFNLTGLPVSRQTDRYLKWKSQEFFWLKRFVINSISISSFDFWFQILISSFDFGFRFRVYNFDSEFPFPFLVSILHFQFEFRILISSSDFEFRVPIWSLSGQFGPMVLALRASLVLLYWPFGPV